MPRARGPKEYTFPIKGVNTEANVLHFPQEFAVDALNVEVDYNPQMLKARKGLDDSRLPVIVETRNLSDHDVAISSFLWENVNNDPNKAFIVVQVGRYLYFFDEATTLSSDLQASKHTERVDLNDALSGTSKGTLALLEPTRVSYANIKGKLVVCCPQIEPTVVQWDGSNLTPAKVSIKQRDMLGINDGLQIDERPVSLTDDHKYNLLNQGWYKQRRLVAGGSESDPIAEYFSQHSVYPSNADIVWVGMVEASGDLVFNAEWLRDHTFGSTPAPKGHYVVNSFNIDRDASLTSSGNSGHSTTGGVSGGGDGGGTPPYDWDEFTVILTP